MGLWNKLYKNKQETNTQKSTGLRKSLWHKSLLLENDDTSIINVSILMFICDLVRVCCQLLAASHYRDVSSLPTTIPLTESNVIDF